MYFEECGNPRGQPALLVHGGPGGGSNPTMRRFHDPSHYRIILFDQRGCGRSTPNASLETNTTWHLVADMERLREALGIERWQLFGGSWGSTLALAYAETHPERVEGLILRGIFLVRQAELQWFYQEGCSWIYPDAFAAYASVIPPAERGDMIAAYTCGSLPILIAQIRLAAAKAWSVWEGSTLSLVPDAERIRHFGADAYAMAFARIECHYFVNRGFLRQRRSTSHRCLAARRHSGRHHPRPLRCGDAGQECLGSQSGVAEAELRIVADAGHAMSEPGISHELVSATRRYRRDVVGA